MKKSHQKWILVVRKYQKFPLYSCLVLSFGIMKTNVLTFLGLANIFLFLAKMADPNVLGLQFL